MKFSKKTLSKLRYFSAIISILGWLLINTESLYLLSLILIGIGFLSFALLTRYLNSFPLTDKEIIEIESTHKKGKSFFIYQGLKYGLILAFLHFFIGIVESYWLNEPFFEEFSVTKFIGFSIVFFGLPIIAGYAIWKTNEETYQQLQPKKAANL
jgi:hypothetical protein